MQRHTALAALLLLTACAAESTAPPVSTGSAAAASHEEPQPIGSLPTGSATQDPLVRSTGDIATFRLPL